LCRASSHLPLALIIEKKTKKDLILFRISLKISIVRSESFSYQQGVTGDVGVSFSFIP
jgi:hypothetical protein